jgi:hypothetical protein
MRSVDVMASDVSIAKRAVPCAAGDQRVSAGGALHLTLCRLDKTNLHVRKRHKRTVKRITAILRAGKPAGALLDQVRRN